MGPHHLFFRSAPCARIGDVPTMLRAKREGEVVGRHCTAQEARGKFKS